MSDEKKPQQRTIIGRFTRFSHQKDGTTTRLTFNVPTTETTGLQLPTDDVAMVFPGTGPSPEVAAERARCYALVTRYVRFDHQTHMHSWHDVQDLLDVIAAGERRECATAASMVHLTPVDTAPLEAAAREMADLLRTANHWMYAQTHAETDEIAAWISRRHEVLNKLAALQGV